MADTLMDLVVDDANSDRERPGRHTRVSGVQGRVYSGDILVAFEPGFGSCVAGGARQARREASFYTESEAEQEPLVVRLGDGSGGMHGFQAGDMVWGKVKSHPWWPGYIFHESFCPSSVLRTKREGHVLVAFFGDNSYGWLDPAELLPFDQHFAEKSKQSTSRNFIDAVSDALDEVSRRGALGLSCCCHNPDNFRKATAPGYVVVDILGHQNNVVCSKSVVGKARNSFIPVNVTSFVRKLAVGPCEADLQDVDTVKMVAILEAFRKASNEGLVGLSSQPFELEPAKPQSDSQGTQQESTFRESRGRRRKKAGATVVDNPGTNQYIFKRRIDAPAPASSHAGEHPTSPPPCSTGDSPFKPFEPLSANGVQPSPRQAGLRPESSDLDSPVPVGSQRTDGRRVPSVGVLPVAAQGQPLVWESAASGLSSPGVGEFRLQKRRDAATDSSFLANKEMPFKMKRTRENGRTPSLALGSWKDDMEEDTVGEQSSRSAHKEAGAWPNVPSLKKLARGQSGTGKLQGNVNLGEVSSARVPVSRSEPVVPPREHEGSLLSLEDSLSSESLVAHLKALAVDVFHGESDGVPPAVRQSFLRHRSTFNQRSIMSSPLNRKGDAFKTKQTVSDGKEGVPNSAIAAITTPEVKEARPLPAAVMEEPKKVVEKDVRMKQRAWDASGTESQPINDAAKQGVREQTVKDSCELAIPQITVGSMPELSVEQPLPVADREVPNNKGFEEVVRKKRSVWEGAENPEDMIVAKKAKTVAQMKALAAARKQQQQARKACVLPDRAPSPPPPQRAFGKKTESRMDKNTVAAVAPTTRQVKVSATLPVPATTHAFPSRPSPQGNDDTAVTDAKRPKAVKPPRAPAHEEAQQRPSPTYLILQFPPRSSLPSVPSLKARLVRFGPLDPSGCRVTWSTRTCHVLFRRAADAARACEHVSSAEGSGRMFGPEKPSCSLLEVNANAPPGFGDTTAPAHADAPVPGTLTPTLNPKSCLKQVKEASERHSGLRVKFMLEGADDENDKLCACGGSSGRNGGEDVGAPAVVPVAAAGEERQHGIPDVSEQVLELLQRCHGVVSGLRASLGHMPYYSL